MSGLTDSGVTAEPRAEEVRKARSKSYVCAHTNVITLCVQMLRSADEMEG